MARSHVGAIPGICQRMAINLLAVATLLAVSLGPANATTPKDKQPLAKMIGVSDPVQAQSPTKYEPIADLSGTTMMVEARNSGSIDAKIMEKRMGLPFTKVAAEGFERDMSTLAPLQKNLVLKYYSV